MNLQTQEKSTDFFDSEVSSNTSNGWRPIGYVHSTYLKLDGQYIINPSTEKPYIVPVGYNPENTINRFVEYDQKTLFFKIYFNIKLVVILICKEDSMVKNLVDLLMIIEQLLLSISA